MDNKQYFFKTMRYVRPYMLPYAIGIFLYSAQQFLFPLVISLFMGSLMAAILAGSFRDALMVIPMFMGMTVVSMAFIAPGTYIYIVNMARATRDLKRDLFRTFVRSSIESNAHSGEGIAAINTDANTAENLYSDSLSAVMNNIIAAVFSSVTVLIIDIRLGLGTIVIGFLAFFVQSRFAAPLAKIGTDRLNANADSVKVMSNIFAGALSVRAFSRQQKAMLDFDKENKKLRDINFKDNFLGMWRNLFTTIQGWLVLVLVFALGGWLVATGELTLDLLIMVPPLAQSVGGAMSNIGASWAGLQPPLVAAKRVIDIIESVPAEESQTGESAEWNGNYNLSIKNLNFKYQDAGANALSEINLEIKENEMIAFVGESGSGKSTLLRAVIGMYQRKNMPMNLGSLTPANLKQWRKHFAYVDQTCKLFDMSIEENIAMGNPGATDELKPGVENAAKRAFAHDFISALPEGYKTECGEKGSSLSGGQKQRIAIARALYRQAPILVFDEATSALDSESETNIMETIQNLRQDHTILITTHNLQNTINADKIVVMDKGRIAEQGTHEELLEKRGIYHRLFTMED